MKALLEKEVNRLKNINIKIQQNKPEDKLLSFDRSIESRKKDLVEEIHSLCNEGKFKNTRTDLTKLYSINNQILNIVSNERIILKTNRVLDKRFLGILKQDVVDNKRANKIIEGLIDLVPSIQGEIQQYLNMGIIGLNDVRLMLEQIEGINLIEIETISLILSELEELQSNLKRQNKIINNLKGSFLKKMKFFGKKQSIKDQYKELFMLVGREFLFHNRFLRNIGYHNKLVIREDNYFKEIDWLEEIQIHLVDDISLLLEQTDKPKLIVPSGNLVVFSCSKKEALQIIKDREIRSNNTFQLHSTKATVAFVPQSLNYIPFDINKVNDKLSYAFVFALEEVTKNNFFFFKDTNKDLLKIVGKNSVQKEIENQLYRFSEFTLTINKQFGHLLEKYGNINKKEKNDLSKEYAKNLIKEMKEKNSLIYSTLVEIVSPDELSEINALQLIKLIKKAKKYYRKIINNMDGFFKTDIKLDIQGGFFAAPASEVLTWEKRFKESGFRPNTLYYKTKQEIVDVDSIKVNPGLKELPKFKLLLAKETDFNNILKSL